MEENMYPFTIEIDGARADSDQHWRIYRIHRILGYAQAIADLDNNEAFYKKVSGFCDEKGILFVTWFIEPTEKEKEYIKKAWESIVTDYESNEIEHDVL
jgi:hypothetical protein